VTAPAAFDGFLEVYNAHTISGWAVLGPECGDKSLLVKIDGTLVAEVVPDLAPSSNHCVRWRRPVAAWLTMA